MLAVAAYLMRVLNCWETHKTTKTHGILFTHLVPYEFFKLLTLDKGTRTEEIFFLRISEIFFKSRVFARANYDSMVAIPKKGNFTSTKKYKKMNSL